MSQYIVKNRSLNGEITIPSSKSHTLRSILFGSLGKGKSIIHRYLHSSDTKSMAEACRLFGAEVDFYSDRIEISGIGGKILGSEDVIHAGNSGIVLRFCSAIGALAKHPIVITGDRSIRYHRPMKPLLEGLSQLGVSTASMRGDGYAPIILKGPIRPGKAVLSGEDSQPVSALLIASAFAEGPIELEVHSPGEKPWVALTLDWFDRLGIVYENHGFERYRLPGNTLYHGFECTIPGDLSSAAFPIAAALVTRSELTLQNIDMCDSQGDKELVAVLQKTGAQLEINEFSKSLFIKKSSTLSGITVDINNFIDAATILAVVGCFAEGRTEIRNASVARQKECDRLRCITTELKKMGAKIAETEDGLSIQHSPLKGAALHSYDDHRMAMSLTVAALGASGETTVSSVECVAKTFPTFVRDFNALGAEIEER